MLCCLLLLEVLVVANEIVVYHAVHCMCRLYAEQLCDSRAQCSASAPLENGAPHTPKACKSAVSVLESAESSIEHRRSSVNTSLSLSGIRSSSAAMSAERPPHSGVSRPGRDGIKLNSDASRMVSLLKRSDSCSSESRPDVLGLSTPQSYVDKFSEFLSHGK